MHRILYFIFFFLLLISPDLPAQELFKKDSGFVQPDYTVIVFGSIGGVFGVSASDFFAEYNDPFLVGGQASSFNIPFSVGGGVKVTSTPELRFGLTSEFYKASFTDNYEHQVVFFKDGELDTLGARNVVSELAVNSMPILLTVEFVPVEAQFTTYFGAGAGISLNKIFWAEAVQSNVAGDPRGGLYNDEMKITPAGRIYAGVELDFDKRRREPSILGSLLIEVRYTYIPVSVPLLERFAEFPGAPQRWKGDFSVGGSGLGLHIGLSVEFPGFFKKK